MNTALLRKYISGQAADAEKKQVVEWIQQHPNHMREYMAQRKLHDIAVWRTRFETQGGELSERKRISWHVMRMRVVKMTAVFALAFLSAYYWVEKQQVPESPSMQTIHVPAGQRTELILADGTKVWLNARSTLSFSGHFHGAQRRVKLDGEAYFDVVKNDKQPFVVETGRYEVKVLGTEFNVMAYSTDSVWETALLRGAVEVTPRGSTASGIKLEANTMVRLKNGTLMKSVIRETDHFRWREGLICFNNITVCDMFEKLKLYYGVNIVVRNKEILDNRYTGKFRTNDGVEHVLRVLKLKNRFTYSRDDESNTITIY